MLYDMKEVTPVAGVEHVGEIEANEDSSRRVRCYIFRISGYICLCIGCAGIYYKFHSISCSNAILIWVKVRFECIDVESSNV